MMHASGTGRLARPPCTGRAVFQRCKKPVSKCPIGVARSFLDSSVVSLDVLASGVAIALSTAGLVAAASKEDVVSKVSVADPGDDQFAWSVATVVSIIPFFSWMVRCPVSCDI
jgi:hypothetical protein